MLEPPGINVANKARKGNNTSSYVNAEVTSFVKCLHFKKTFQKLYSQYILDRSKTNIFFSHYVVINCITVLVN